MKLTSDILDDTTSKTIDINGGGESGHSSLQFDTSGFHE